MTAATVSYNVTLKLGDIRMKAIVKRYSSLLINSMPLPALERLEQSAFGSPQRSTSISVYEISGISSFPKEQSIVAVSVNTQLAPQPW